MSCPHDAELNRRSFVTAAAVAAAGLGILGAAGLPAADGQATTKPAAGGPVDVGAKSDFAADGATMTFVKKDHLIVMRESGKIYAMSSKCTHKHCDVKDAGGSFHCPCHNSDFALDGSATAGPAKRSGALPRYAISVDGTGHLMVDMKKTFAQSKWDDPASFVSVS